VGRAFHGLIEFTLMAGWKFGELTRSCVSIWYAKCSAAGPTGRAFEPGVETAGGWAGAWGAGYGGGSAGVWPGGEAGG